MANLLRKGSRESLGRTGADPYKTVQESMRELMRDMFRFSPFVELESMAQEPNIAFVPQTEVKETGDAFLISVDLPGVDLENIEISASGNRLTVRGERAEEDRQEGETYYTYERVYGSFARSFTLPENADVDQVTAEFKDGVLHVKVPKKAAEQPKRVQIQGGKEAPKAATKEETSATKGAGETPSSKEAEKTQPQEEAHKVKPPKAA